METGRFTAFDGTDPGRRAKTSLLWPAFGCLMEVILLGT